MGKKIVVNDFISKAKQIHGDKYDYSQVDYVNSRTKVKIVCPEHGVFEQLPSSHLQGNGCPQCAKIWSEGHKQNLQISSRKSRGMTTEEWIKRARSVHGDKYDYSQIVYVNQRTKVKIICPIHGVFEQQADSHIRGCGCRLCGFETEARKWDHSWTEEQRQKIAATCMERYGASRYLDSEEGRKKNIEVRSNPDFRKKMHDIISSDEVQEKTKATCVERYGVASPMQLTETVEKVIVSKLKNGNWKTSKLENHMYDMLCEKFGETDVIHQYIDSDRYPYVCDFYIKSLDLFIELNAHWTHGFHWFDCMNENDLKTLNEWKLKGWSYFVWTVRDLEKRNTAIQNHLNYLVFWKNDLSDFKEWLSADVLLLNNIT